MSCSEGVSLVGGAKLTCVHGGETLQSQEEQLTVWSWGRAAVSRGLQPALSDTRTGPGLRGRWCRKSGTVHLSEPPGPLWQEGTWETMGETVRWTPQDFDHDWILGSTGPAAQYGSH